MTEISGLVGDLKDEKYKEFIVPLVPNIDPDTVIGVRMPQLKTLAKHIYKEDAYSGFLQALPHKTFEENNLHGLIISEFKDFDECISALEYFLPYVDNWATCDSIRPKCFEGNKDKLICVLKNWLSSSHVYTVRFAIEMLMLHYLDDNYSVELTDSVAKIIANDYYLKMMIAWYFATALAMQWNSIIPYFEDKKLPVWIHNKAIQKAIESRRITADKKAYLKSLKIKVKGRG